MNTNVRTQRCNGKTECACLLIHMCRILPSELRGDISKGCVWSVNTQGRLRMTHTHSLCSMSSVSHISQLGLSNFFFFVTANDTSSWRNKQRCAPTQLNTHHKACLPHTHINKHPENSLTLNRIFKDPLYYH